MSKSRQVVAQQSASNPLAVTLSQRLSSKRLHIEFMYLDLEVCTRCRTTATQLEAALAEVAGLLEAIGVAASVDNIQVQSLEQAIALNFFSSPTIRVNGHDIQLESKESPCAPCGEISGGDVDCRLWLYQGQEYEAPPAAMIVDALLQALCDSAPTKPARTPIPDSALANLRRFFEGKQQQSAATEAQRGEGECCPNRGCC